jgi:hypothetical protein
VSEEISKLQKHVLVLMTSAVVLACGVRRYSSGHKSCSSDRSVSLGALKLRGAALRMISRRMVGWRAGIMGVVGGTNRTGIEEPWAPA